MSNVSSHMPRVVAAFLLAPLLASLLAGVLAIVVYPVMLAITFSVAFPLFLVLKEKGWLQWWHAILGGASCGACYVVVDQLLSTSSDLDRLINSNNIFYVGLGASIGFAFWWIGIFRNPTFPSVERRLPRAMILIFPVAAAVVWADHSVRVVPYQGRVLTIVKAVGSKDEMGLVSVQLSGGPVVEASLSNTWPTPMVQGRCFHLMERWSTFRFRRIYELASPLGGGVDDC